MFHYTRPYHQHSYGCYSCCSASQPWCTVPSRKTLAKATTVAGVQHCQLLDHHSRHTAFNSTMGQLHPRRGLQNVILFLLVTTAGQAAVAEAARGLSTTPSGFPEVAQEPAKDGPLVAAVINPTGFHFEVGI